MYVVNWTFPRSREPTNVDHHSLPACDFVSHCIAMITIVYIFFFLVAATKLLARTLATRYPSTVPTTVHKKLFQSTRFVTLALTLDSPCSCIAK